MMPPSNEAKHIFNQLRAGLVPEHGLDTFAIGVEKQREEIRRQLGLVQEGSGSVKFLRGGYGCGKTFMARLAIAEAQARGFATSFVVVSDNDLRFHRFEEVYRKVVAELSTPSCPRGALGDILDRWISNVEEALIKLGADPDAPGFDVHVRTKLREQLATITGGRAPADFIRVIQTIFDLKQKGEIADAMALTSWISGSSNIAASVKRLAEIKGDIASTDALAYLRGILEIAKAAGYRGMLIVIDEAETILRMRSDSRHMSLNGIRQISDASADYPGLLWMFTGTPDFFDNRKGVAGLAPLHDRIHFKASGGFASHRQPQLELKPFDRARLEAVALRLRALYPMANRERVQARVTDRFIRQLVDHMTAGFKGDVGVVPRQFLRELIHIMDLVDEYAEYNPEQAYEFSLSAFAESMTAEERAAAAGRPLAAPTQDAEDDEAFVPVAQVW